MLHFMVLGAGAIGSLFGALLSEKYDVTLVGRKKHADAINKKGLTITGLINKIFTVRAATDIETIEKDCMILLTTKTHDTVSAIKKIKDKVRPDTTIVVLQNGLGQEDGIAKLVDCRVLRAVTEQGALFVEPGVIKIGGRFPTYLEKGGEAIAQYLNNTGVKTTVVENIKQKEWEKLVINCVINGLGAVLGVPNDKLNHPELEAIKKAIVAECRLVAKAEGITFDANILVGINKLISRSTNVNSTLQDLKAGKKTEIDYLNGAVVRLGKKHKIATPVNETLYRLIKTFDHPPPFLPPLWGRTKEGGLDRTSSD